jgi:TolB protein
VASAATTKRISLKSSGNEVNADSDAPALSASGRFVAFESVGQFVPGDTGTDADIFVRDTGSHKTTRVSVKSDGGEANGDSEQASVSADGRLVAFTSEAALVAGDTNGVEDVYVRDRKAGKTKRVSVTPSGQQVFADSSNPSISADGRFVAFQSDAAVVGTDTNGVSDVYVRDMNAHTTLRVSLRSNGTQPTQPSTLSDGGTVNRASRISSDGRFVTFESNDGHMTGRTDCCNPPLFDSDVFVRDLQNNKTARVSLKSNGGEADQLNQVASGNPSISGDGRFVAFQSVGAFVGGDANGQADIYVRDRNTGNTLLVSVKSNGSQGSGPVSSASTLPSISASGRFVCFESYAALVGSDANPARDVYVRDRTAGTTKRASVKSNGQGVSGYEHQLSAISGDGRFVAFISFGHFTAGDAGTDFDVFERGPLF